MTIVAVAISISTPKGDLICTMAAPARHHDVLQAMNDQYHGARKHSSILQEEQGFLDDKGNFLNRKQAYEHALRRGPQIKRTPGKGYQGNELFSEDVW